MPVRHGGQKGHDGHTSPLRFNTDTTESPSHSDDRSTTKPVNRATATTTWTMPSANRMPHTLLWAVSLMSAMFELATTHTRHAATRAGETLLREDQSSALMQRRGQTTSDPPCSTYLHISRNALRSTPNTNVTFINNGRCRTNTKCFIRGSARSRDSKLVLVEE